jgi:hypothetical protein
MAENNYGKVGEALYIKFTPEGFQERLTNKFDFIDGQILSVDEINSGKYGNISASVPVHISNDTQGDYDVVCEYGTEVYFYNDQND